mgnify:CR=1 FL=1
MKLNHFFEKQNKPIKKKTSFTLNNVAKEEELQNKINLLTQQIERKKNVESKNDELKQKADHAFKEQKKALNSVADLEEYKDKSELELNDLRPKAQLLPQIQKTLMETEERALAAVKDLNEIKLAKKTQEKNIEFLSKERVEFQRDYLNEVKKTKNTLEELHKTQDTLKDLQKKYNNLESFVDKLSKINIEQKKTLEQLEIEASYYEQEAEGAKEYMAQLESRRDEVLDLLNTVNSKSSKHDSTEKFLSNKVTKAEAKIVTLEKEYNDLKQEAEYVASLARTYKLELDKPRYESLSSISRKEGFTIPGIASAKNYNKLHLGNAKPTLLKFN